MFPNTPVVFSGVNDFQDSMLQGNELFTGVVESVDIKGTIDLGLRLQPNTKQVIIINDQTTTGLEMKKLIMDLVPNNDHYNKADIVFLEGLSIFIMKNILKEYKDDSIILNTATVFKDDQGEIISIKDALIEISQNTNFPIYTLWDSFIGNGVVGGRVIKGIKQGEIAGEISKEILEGVKPTNIPVVKRGFYSYVFDYKALQRFHIEEALLPSGSVIINKPSYTISKNVVYSIIIIIMMILLIIITFLFDSNMKRRTVEGELRKSKERYKKLVELSPDGIIVHNSQGKIIYANPAIIEMIEGESSRDIVGKSVINFVKEEYRQDVQNGIRYLTTHTNGTYPPNEQKIYTLKGKFLDVEVVGAPISYISDSDILVIARDISERKRIEELKAKIQEEEILLKEAKEYDQLKTEFFSNLSHEFRTPLNVILGSIQLLNRDSRDIMDNTLSYKIKKRTKTLKQNCYRLLRLVNNLIDITKIDANYYELSLGNYNIVRIVEDITLSVVDYIEQRDIELIFDTDIEEKIIACDPDKIERIILNIISNSLKFTKPGGSISVNIMDMEEEICISIKDTGIGIKEDKKKIIFDRFRQADKSFTRNHEGSGIGLSLVKSLVEMHEGRIILNSEYGRGSEFIICIPSKTIENNDKKENNINADKDYVELINIEFSDIYE